MDVRTYKDSKNGRMNKMTEDNCRIGDPKVMTNTKGAPFYVVDVVKIRMTHTSQ